MKRRQKPRRVWRASITPSRAFNAAPEEIAVIENAVYAYNTEAEIEAIVSALHAIR